MTHESARKGKKMEHIPTLAELREQHGEGDDLAAAVDRALAGHVAAMEAIDAAADGGELTASQQRRWDVHSRAVDELRAWSKERRAENLRRSRARFGAVTVGAERPEPTAKLSDVQQRALRTVDEQRNLDSAAGDRLHELIRSENPDCDGEVIAARTVLTMDPHYRSAFMQLTTQQHPMLTDEEVRAVRAVKDWERRAMQIGDPNAGGLAVPVVIDPTIVLTAQGSANPFTGLARIETITTDTWRGLTSTGVTWRWADELSEATDNSPSILRPEIPAVRADGFIPFSIEIGQDWANFQSEMTRLLASGYNELVVEALTTGTTGAGEPTGVVSRLETSTAVGVQLATTTAGEIGGVDLRALWAGLPPRVRNSDRTGFMSSVSVREHVRRLAADPAGVGEGDPSFALTGGLMFERPYRVNEFMDVMPTGTSAATLMVVGDFTGFVIAQRAGMTVEFIPHLFGSTNNRPIGGRGLFAWARIGSDVIDEGRFRILVNKTS